MTDQCLICDIPAEDRSPRLLPAHDADSGEDRLTCEACGETFPLSDETRREALSDSPAVPVARVPVPDRRKGDPSELFCIWCRYCRDWHYHGPLEGHRVAHCADANSPYKRTGYVLVEVRR